MVTRIGKRLPISDSLTLPVEEMRLAVQADLNGSLHGRSRPSAWLSFLAYIDLPLNFHPAAIRASAGFTPWGAGGATCDRRSWSGLRSRSHVAAA